MGAIRLHELSDDEFDKRNNQKMLQAQRPQSLAGQRSYVQDSASKKEPRRSAERNDGAPGSFSLMLSCDSEKREGVCHKPEPLLVLMGRAAAATGEATVR
ncbi:hypothetical protein BHM03_00051118 [Ensete ventricosum]|nr:hypothetical protein BHM03_00051118 [Ensete ventricosum]